MGPFLKVPQSIVIVPVQIRFKICISCLAIGYACYLRIFLSWVPCDDMEKYISTSIGIKLKAPPLRGAFLL